MKDTVFYIVLIFMFQPIINCQNTEWQSYQKPSTFCNNSIAVSEAYLWVASDSGLIKFDRKDSSKFIYTKSNSPIVENRVTEVVCDEGDNIWCVSGRGFGEKRNLLKMSNGTWENYIDFPNMPAIKTKLCLTVENELIFTNRDSVYKFNGNTLKAVLLCESWQSNFVVYDLKSMHNDVCWVATNIGLIKIDFEKNEKELIHNLKASSLTVQDKMLWIGTQDSGVYKYEDGNLISYCSQNSGLFCDSVLDIEFDSEGILWLTTFDGLAKFDGNQWFTYKDIDTDIVEKEILNFETGINSMHFVWKGSVIGFDGEILTKAKIGEVETLLSSNHVTNLAFDSDNTLWISTIDTVFQSFRDGMWKTYSVNDTLILNSKFNLIYNDSNTTLWKGKGILVKYAERKTWYVNQISNGYKSGKVLMDKNDVVWESSNGGLIKYSEGKKTVYTKSNSNLPTNNLGYLCLNRKGALLLGTLPNLGEHGFLLEFNGKNFETVYTCPMDHCILSMIWDKSNNLWFSELYRSTVGVEFGEGLVKYDGVNYHRLTADNSELSSNSVFSLCFDKEDKLWIGTCGGGLDIFDLDNTWKNYHSGNSIIDFNSISCIQTDALGNMAFAVEFFGLIYAPFGTVEIQKRICNNGSLSAIIVPNPTTSRSEINYNLKNDEIVDIAIYDMHCRFVKHVLHEIQNRGSYSKQIDLSGFPRGTYFCKLKVGDELVVEKMVVQ